MDRKKTKTNNQKERRQKSVEHSKNTMFDPDKTGGKYKTKSF